MRRFTLTVLLALSSAAVSACAYHDGYGYGPSPFGDYAYQGDEWGDRGAYAGPLVGPGVTLLDPWLLETPEGQDIVTTGFRDAREGFVDEQLADRVNIWFRRYADTNRDMRLTDPEIRVALVQASQGGRF